MIEYFYFNESGITSDQYEISITTSLDKLYYRIEYADGKNVIEGEYYLDDIWLREFENLNLNNWKQEYRSEDIFIEKGFSWEISYKEVNKPSHYIKGDNKYPPSWNQLIYFLSSLNKDAHLVDLFIKEPTE